TATEARLKTIVAAERLRREQQPGLQAHVRRLQAEFEEGSV
ncbi:MAG: guanylate kinase, partial [Pseudomonadota bacterium]